MDPIGRVLEGVIKVFEISKKADIPLYFWNHNLRLPIAYEMERQSSGPDGCCGAMGPLFEWKRFSKFQKERCIPQFWKSILVLWLVLRWKTLITPPPPRAPDMVHLTVHHFRASRQPKLGFQKIDVNRPFSKDENPYLRRSSILYVVEEPKLRFLKHTEHIRKSSLFERSKIFFVRVVGVWWSKGSSDVAQVQEH